MRPTWDNYFMGLSYHASTRSHDTQTKVGCVIVGDKRVISMGYNGFCAGVNDDNLPTTRPNKYPFMVHAEENAISNMLITPSSVKTAYITHQPCNRCAKLLWQNNIHHWFLPENNKAHGFSGEDAIVYGHLIDNGLKITYMNPDLSYLNRLIEQ